MTHPLLWIGMQIWQFLYFLLNKYNKFKNWTFWNQTFWNLTFCKPDVLKPDVLKPDFLKPDVLKPDVLWVYPNWLKGNKYFYVILFTAKKIQNYLNSIVYCYIQKEYLGAQYCMCLIYYNFSIAKLCLIEHNFFNIKISMFNVDFNVKESPGLYIRKLI